MGMALSPPWTFLVGLFLWKDTKLSNPPTDAAKACLKKESSTISLLDNKSSVYDDHRIPVNARYDQDYPSLIVKIKTVADIQASVRCSGQLRIPLNAFAYSDAVFKFKWIKT